MSHDAELHYHTTDLHRLKIYPAQLSGLHIDKDRACLYADRKHADIRYYPFLSEDRKDNPVHLFDRIESGLSLRIQYRDNHHDYNRKSRYDGLAPKESSRQDDQ